MAALPFITAGVAAYGAISSANAQADAKNQQLELGRQQAAELDARQAINDEILQRQGSLQISNLETTAEGRGNFGVGFDLAARANLLQARQLQQRDADFKARMLRAGIGIEQGINDRQVPAAYLAQAGTLLGGASQAYSNYYRYGSKGTVSTIPGAGSGGSSSSYDFQPLQSDYTGDPYGSYA